MAILRWLADSGKAVSGYKAHTWFGVMVRAGSPQQFAAFMAAETIKWAKVIKASGARVD